MQESFRVTVISQGKEKAYSAKAGDALKELFARWGISIPMPCGGNGRCGKCRILIDGEEKLLCRTLVEKDCVVGVPSEHEKEEFIEAEGRVDSSFAGEGSDDLGIAVDLGTTTIVAALLQGDRVKTASCVNHQRRFGSDVISRIRAASDPLVKEEMRRSVLVDIEQLVKELVPKGRRRDLKIITVAGNTTMLHLLAGEDVSGLGAYPYTPSFLDFLELEYGDEKTGMVLLPGISAFVGADIVSGLYYLTQASPGDEGPEEKDFLFIDLGTNGEMAVCGDEGISVTSTAAGPVFEGGEISCGMASVPGAISHVRIKDGPKPEVTFETIGGEPAMGICGTGALELVSELVRCGIVDETGLLKDEYFDAGFPVTVDGKVRFTQKDIRAIQLGKAAIAAGIRALTQDAIPSRIYVAGGFGSASEPARLWNLKMFPADFGGKIVIAGNTALKGAVSYTLEALRGAEAQALARQKIMSIVNNARVVELAQQDDFGEEYINSMNF